MAHGCDSGRYLEHNSLPCLLANDSSEMSETVQEFRDYEYAQLPIQVMKLVKSSRYLQEKTTAHRKFRSDLRISCRDGHLHRLPRKTVWRNLNLKFRNNLISI